MRGQSARQFEQPLLAIRQAAGLSELLAPEADESQQLQCLRPHSGFFSLLRGRLKNTGHEARPGLAMLADQQIFQHREISEKTDVLERPGDAEGGDDMRFFSANGLPSRTISPADGT